MRFGASGKLALQVGLLTGVLSAPALIYYLAWETGLILAVGVSLLSGLVVFFITEHGVYHPLRQLDAELQEVLQQSSLPTSHEQDAVGRIRNGLMELIVKTRRELLHLQELESFRKEFIGDVSHELKTPLFAIEGFLETLLDGAMEDRNVNRKFLKQALKNVARLNNLVKDLMVLSQLEAGEMEMKKEPFRLYELVLDVADLLDYKLSNKGRNLTLHVDGQGLEQVQVVADKERIRQVLVNLLDNAINHGRVDGDIQISLEALGEKLKVNVHDEGPGIAPEHLPHIFGRFYRVDKSRTREHGSGGTGLGLSIVKNLVEAHGEEIHVQSSSTTGTTFAFTLTRAAGR